MPRGYDHYPELEDTLYDEPCRYDDDEEAWRQHAMYRHYQRAWEEDDRGLLEPQWDNLVESPEKQAVFQNLLARFQAQLAEFRGKISVTEGELPGCRDIHLYVDHIYLDNITDDNFSGTWPRWLRWWSSGPIPWAFTPSSAFPTTTLNRKKHPNFGCFFRLTKEGLLVVSGTPNVSFPQTLVVPVSPDTPPHCLHSRSPECRSPGRCGRPPRG